MSDHKYPDLESHLLAIVEKYSGLPAQPWSNLEMDLAMDVLTTEWAATECFKEFCPHLDFDQSDIDDLVALSTVEEWVQRFEDLADERPRRSGKYTKDFKFNF